MVLDPPDGRLPARTPRSAALAAAALDARARRAAAPPEGPEDLSPWVRCITRSLIPTPGGYNNGLQIVQGPGYVAITREMIHETRIIPTEARPAIGSDMTSYLGHSQGRWEGDTLVVESTHFNGGAPFQGSSQDMTLVERYTRIGPNTLEYQFTVDDPTTYTEPWGGVIPYKRFHDKLFEYAYHEGKYRLGSVLSGARYEERLVAGSSDSNR